MTNYLCLTNIRYGLIHFFHGIEIRTRFDNTD